MIPLLIFGPNDGGLVCTTYVLKWAKKAFVSMSLPYIATCLCVGVRLSESLNEIILFMEGVALT
jgi:hypothetical protein